MRRLPKIIRYTSFIAVWAAGGATFVFAVLVLVRIVMIVPLAQAANSTLNPLFCLGGWNNPQKAAGTADIASTEAAAPYSSANSAVLEQSVSAQLFCGYFSSRERAHSPTKATLRFNWDMKDPGGQAVVPAPAATKSAESFSSSSGFVIATSTGFEVPAPVVPVVPAPVSAPVPVPATALVSSSTPADIAPSQPTSEPTVAPVPSSETQTETASPSPDNGPVQAPAPEASSQPPSSLEPSAAPVPPPESPSGFIDRLIGLVAHPVYAQAEDSAPDRSQSGAPFLEVSYSLDGVRWTSVGTVGPDNWQGYQIDIPVTSWADMAHLQIMLTPLPSLDKKPTIYLDAMLVTVSYDRTAGEVILDAVEATSDAVDMVANALTGQDAALKDQEPPAPRFVSVVHRKLLFEQQGSHIPSSSRGSVKVDLNHDGTSLKISGSCAQKYFVIMVFRNASDYKEKPSSALVNGAGECHNGSFSYDLSALSPDTADGTYYVLTGEEGETGPWTPTSQIIPITVQASSTVETMIQP